MTSLPCSKLQLSLRYRSTSCLTWASGQFIAVIFHFLCGLLHVMEIDVCSTKALHEKQSSALASSISKMSCLSRKTTGVSSCFLNFEQNYGYMLHAPFLVMSLIWIHLLAMFFTPLPNASNLDHCQHQLVFLPVSFCRQCNTSQMFQPQSDPPAVAMKYTQWMVKKSLLIMGILYSSMFFFFINTHSYH